MITKKENKFLIIFVMSILLQIVFIYFLLLPTYWTLKDAVLNIVEEQRKSSELKLDLSNINKFLQVKEKEKEFFQRLNDSFVPIKEPIEFLDFVESVVSQHSSDYEISDGGRLEDDLGEYIILNVSFKASVPDSLKIIHKFQNSKYLMSVELVGMNYENQDGSVDLRLKAYIK